MKITLTELKNNFDKYIELVRKEDIVVTKNGHEIVKITDVNDRPLKSLDSALNDVSITDQEIKNIKWERLKNI